MYKNFFEFFVYSLREFLEKFNNANKQNGRNNMDIRKYDDNIITIRNL